VLPEAELSKEVSIGTGERLGVFENINDSLRALARSSSS
jgi:hypothetical protein